MLAAIILRSARKPAVVLGLALLFAAIALHAFRQLPVEAFPDVTDPSVDVVAVFPGQSAEEVERRVSLELERALAGTPRVTSTRIVSVYGLALATLRFDDRGTTRENRALVAERLREAELPDGVEASLGPDATPVGQVYRYTLRGPRSLRELRAIQDFVVERRLRAVDGVADVVTFGGFERQYAVRLDPVRLAAMGLSVGSVYTALERANANAGGGNVAIGSQEFVVRGLGLLRDPGEIGEALVAWNQGVPVHVRDVADVVESSTPRRGAVGRGETDEVVEGIVLLRRGENPSDVLEGIRARISELEHGVLPRDVHVDAFYDRQRLVDATLSTVQGNLLHGAVLVIAVLYLFLRTLRGAVIVGAVIPLALGAAFVGLTLLGRSANLISLGAIDFGILVDGAVVVLEATLYALDRRRAEDRGEVIAKAGASVARPVGYAMAIIVAGLLPVFTLERVEGRIFSPMALTYAFALVGALAAAFTVVPALERVLLPKQVPQGDPRWLAALRRWHGRALHALKGHRAVAVALTLAVTVAAGAYARGIGTEFLPELDEGGLYITAVFPSTVSLDEVRRQVPGMRARMMAIPETTDVLSHIGRPEHAAQAEGPNNVEFFVALAPRDRWRRGLRRQDLEDGLRDVLGEVPGVQYNFSQPITDRVYETLSGIIGQVVVKVRGDDLATLQRTAEALRTELRRVPGVTDLAIYQAGDAPQLAIELDRERLAQHGLTVDEAQQVIEIALGGKVATSIWEGQRRFDVALRLPDATRADPEALGRLTLGEGDRRATLAEVADIHFTRGRAAIWREDLSRFVALKFNVRGRDLGSVVREARRRAARVPLAEGVTVKWGGEFENQARAMKRLGVTVPLALLLVALILRALFGRWKPALAILSLLPVAVLGAVAGLRLAGENLSVSAAVGCVALLGQVALGGVLVCERVDEAAEHGDETPSLTGAVEALRPVLLTSTLAALGLVPAALSHAMGSETQRPFAIAIIAGVVSALPAVLLLLPLVYRPTRPPPEAVVHHRVSSPPPAAIAVFIALFVALPSAARAQESGPMADERAVVDAWLARSPEARALRARVTAERWEVVTAGLLPNPELALGVNILATGVPPDGRYNGSAQLTLPVLASGQRGARREAASAGVAQVEAEVAEALWERVNDLHGYALDRAWAESRRRLWETGVTELASVEAIARSRGGAGLGTTYDTARIATARANLQAELDATALERDRAEASLLAALGEGDVQSAPVTVEGVRPVALPESLEAVEALALRTRPDVARARIEVRRQGAESERARADGRPVPSFWLGGYVTAAEGSVSVLGGVSVPLPVFDRNQGRVGRALAERDAARLRLESLEARARAEVRGAWRVRASAREALARFEQSGVAATTELLEQARRAWQAGAFSIAELLDAYRAELDARAQALRLGRAVADADAALAKAVGTFGP